MHASETDPLLSCTAFWPSFIIFCLSFGLNHGALQCPLVPSCPSQHPPVPVPPSTTRRAGSIVAMLSLASSIIEGKLAGEANGLLYIMYGITALLAAFGVVRWLGAVRAAAAAMTLYAGYVLSYAIAVSVPSAASLSVYVGGVVGGVAAGTLWTAQGVYLSRSTAHYMASQGRCTKQEATSKLAGVFAAILLALELAVRLLSSFFLFLDGSRSTDVGFIWLTTLLAILGALPVWGLSEVPSAADDTSPPSLLVTLSAAISLNVRESIILLLAPFNLSFGLMSALVRSRPLSAPPAPTPRHTCPSRTVCHAKPPRRAAQCLVAGG